MPCLLVVGQKLRRHLLVGVEALSDHVFLVVRPVLEIGVRGGRVILQVVNLSSAFVGAAEARHARSAAPSGTSRATTHVELLAARLRAARPAPRPGGPSAGSRRGGIRSWRRPPRCASRDEIDHDLVGDEAARRHHLRRARRERAGGLRRAEHVAGRDLRDPHFSQMTLACVPLPAPGGPTKTSLLFMFGRSCSAARIAPLAYHPKS